MMISEYETEARRTAAMDKPPDVSLAVFGLGLAGETGEVVELIKKHLGHGIPINQDLIRKELGDVLWYLAAIAGAVGVSLEDVAQANVTKLRARYPDGFEEGGGVR